MHLEQLYQEIDGKKCEPIERLVVDVPAESVGSVIEKLGPVSYTHLDVYKRQVAACGRGCTDRIMRLPR